MKKMPCLFVREFHDRRSFTITPEVTPGCEWVLAGEGAATRKWDGTACLVRDGVLYKRYDAKRDRKTGEFRVPPTGAIPCCEPDEVTGHWPHWVIVGLDVNADKWHLLAWHEAGGSLPDGTYELIGPPINGDAEGVDALLFKRHGEVTFGAVDEALRSGMGFEFLDGFLLAATVEGIVFHRANGDMCKLRRADFGHAWPVSRTAVTT